MDKISEQQICPSVFGKMINLIFINFTGGNNKLLLPNQELSHLPDTLMYLEWDFCPLKSLPSNFSPNNLVILWLRYSNYIEQLWNEDQEIDLVNLRVMNLSRCKKFRKIPNLLGAKRLESIWSRDCLSLVQLPFMTHLISLKSINLSNCPITKFPEVEGLIELQELYLNDTKIQEVPSFIGSLKKLKWLGLSGTNIRELNLKATPTSPIQDVKKLVASASSIPSLQCIRQLDVRKCKSLERVTFADHGDEDHSWDWDEEFLFDECNKLNDASRDNIIAHVMIRIQSRAKQWAKQLAEKSTDVISDNSYAHSVHCRFPGSVISDKFVNWRNLDSGPTRNRDFNVWVTLKSGSVADTDSTRFLCFALCLVLHRKNKRGLSFFINCDYQLNGTHGKYQNSRKNSFSIPKFSSHGEHVHVLFREDMILRDKGYKEASFSFPFHTRRDYISVKNCGVHVLSVDAESFTVTPVSCTVSFRSDESNCLNEDNRSCGPNYSTKLSGFSWN